MSVHFVWILVLMEFFNLKKNFLLLFENNFITTQVLNKLIVLEAFMKQSLFYQLHAMTGIKL